MEFYGVWRRTGHIRVTPWRLNDAGMWEPGDSDEFYNVITNDGLDLYAQSVRSNLPKTQIGYVGVGDDDSDGSPSATDTQLLGEQFRKQVTAYDLPGPTGQIVTTVYLSPAEANFNIRELGWFAGDVDATANSGTMVSRVHYSRNKTNDEAIQIDRTDTFA